MRYGLKYKIFEFEIIYVFNVLFHKYLLKLRMQYVNFICIFFPYILNTILIY